MPAPHVLEKTSSGERVWDIWSVLNRNRVIFLGEDINDYSANIVIAQLLQLEMENKEEPIQIFINSRGGVCSSGLAIIDVMRFIKNPIYTICIGQAASMAAVILACGETGKRLCLPHANVMIHQASGGAEGTTADIRIAAKHIEKTNDILAGIIADQTGKKKEVVLKDIDRDYYMSAEEAKEYGIIDEVISRRK